jgi:hypothetical protein
MTRVDDSTLSLHLEVALATAAPSVLDALADPDRRRRHAAVGEIARQLVERLRCFDIRSDREGDGRGRHPTLFPNDLGPIG